MKMKQMSYKPEVIADSTGKWNGNGCRFATIAEAEAYVKDLMYRWTAVRDTRVIPSNDPVACTWDHASHQLTWVNK